MANTLVNITTPLLNNKSAAQETPSTIARFLKGLDHPLMTLIHGLWTLGSLIEMGHYGDMYINNDDMTTGQKLAFFGFIIMSSVALLTFGVSAYFVGSRYCSSDSLWCAASSQSKTSESTSSPAP